MNQRVPPTGLGKGISAPGRARVGDGQFSLGKVRLG